MSTRLMNCGVCNHAWEIPAEPPSAPVACPNCEAHICACGCGKHLGDMRADSRYHAPACRTALERERWGTTRAARAHVAQTRAKVRLLSDVASDGELAERFRPLIKTAIFDRLRTVGKCHADDLADVYPEGHVDLCRHLATAHFGQLARRKMIEKVEWRKSTAPGRNGGGSWVWKFTKAGWDKYGRAGASAGLPDEGTVEEPDEAASTCSGETGLTGSGSGAGGASSQKHTAGTASPDNTPTGAGGDEEDGHSSGDSSCSGGEAVPLFDDAPARPLHPLADAEAA